MPEPRQGIVSLALAMLEGLALAMLEVDVFTDCGDRHLYMKGFVTLSVIYVYAFVEKQSCAFIIYVLLYPFMLS